MASKNKKRSQFKRETVQVGTGLSHKEAIEQARGQWRHDHRGFKYDPKTGTITGV